MLAGLALAAALAAATPQVQDVTTGEVRGVVHGRLDGVRTPLPSALVQIRIGSVRRTAVADSTGSYRLFSVPSGHGSLRVVHAGHDALELDVLIPAGGTLALDVDLLGRPVAMDRLTVVGDPEETPRDDESPEPEPGMEGVDIRAIAEDPGLVESGIALAARAAVGDDPGDPTDVLFMRGSTTDLKLVLLDGAPVYAPFHMGGMLPTFDRAVMGDATHYVGGAPAQYDGGLSYILDLNTRAPRRDRLAATGALDLISARASVEAPLGAWGGLLVSGRALHGGEAALLAGDESPYGYADALARLEIDVRPGHRVSATAFHNRESVFLDLAGQGLAQAAALDSDANWGNRAASVAYRGTFGRTSAVARVAGGRYDARLPISTREGDLFAQGASGRARLTADLSSPMGNVELRYGASAERTSVAYDAHRLGGGGAILVEDATQGDVLGAYAEAEFPVADRLRLWAGLRVDRFSTDRSVRGAPRLRLAWLLSDAAVLTVAAGRFRQYAPASDEAVEEALVAVVEDDGGVERATEMGPLLPVATASHLVVSLDQMLVPGVRLGLDGFFKAFEGISAPGRRLNASGADVRVQRAGESLTVWLGYSLSWFWSEDGVGYTAEQFTGQQLLSAGFSGRAWNRWGLDLRLGFGDGLPLTALPVSDAATGASVAAGPSMESVALSARVAEGAPILTGGMVADQFFRVDAEISGVFDTRLGSRQMMFRPYLRVMNALGRRDALFYYLEPWRSPDVKPLVESTLLPVIGFEWRF